MTEQRPQYGEIATLEEQRLAAGLPLEVVPEAAEPVEVTVPAASARPHPVDRLVTIALLAYGLVTVVLSGLSYLDLPSAMNESMKMLGIEGEFTNFAQGKLWGTIGAFVLVVGWSITAMLSLRRLRRGKRTWWVPLVGAVVTTVIASICIAVPMLGDPAFIAYLDQMAGR